MKGSMRQGLVGAAAAAALMLAGCQGGAMDGSKTPLSAKLSGDSEVPPKPVAGSGTASLSLDKASKTLSWEISYSGLTGEAKAAHFHGPAAAGANAGVAVPIPVGASPMKGSAVLTDAQVADLLAGKYYINIHTAANQAGELRGQVMPH
jgi:hypothetical protein